MKHYSTEHKRSFNRCFEELKSCGFVHLSVRLSISVSSLLIYLSLLTSLVILCFSVLTDQGPKSIHPFHYFVFQSHSLVFIHLSILFLKQMFFIPLVAFSFSCLANNVCEFLHRPCGFLCHPVGVLLPHTG